MPQILKGNILHAPVMGEYAILPHGCLVVENGRISGVYSELPERYKQLPVTDYGERLIVQAFCDMHLHAPQYPMLGMGLDLPLLKWLSTYTFPAEARFADEDYARTVYRKLAQALVANGTTRVCMFSSIHTEATWILMEELERAGVSGYAGKVNMDRNGGEHYEETTEESKRETLRWLDGCSRFSDMKPMLTPRFVPSCTGELMAWLGALAKSEHLPIQSHLSETLNEIRWVKELHPDCGQYWQVYEKYGLFNDRTIMAHCVHSDEHEQCALASHGVVVAHSPDSNINLCSGFPPVREMLDRGVHAVLASDIAGGAELSMLRVIASAVRMSNAYRIASDRKTEALTVADAYYLATTAAARFFGDGEGFAAGNPLHALVLDDSDFLGNRELSIQERFERLIYLGDARNITARYANGKLLA